MVGEEICQTHGNRSGMKVLTELRGYGLATISCALALAAARPLDAPSSCFFLAVFVSSLYGGKGPGLLSVGLSALAFQYFFLPQVFQPFVATSSLLRFAVFLGATLLIAGLVERKRRVEESSREINERYRTIADTAPDAIISIDASAQMLFVNPAATRTFGWDASEMIGQPSRITALEGLIQHAMMHRNVWIGRCDEMVDDMRPALEKARREARA